MKRKIVLWGANEKDEKQLVALELLDAANKVNVYTFDETIATEEFYNKMMDDWREDKEVEFPVGFKTIERSLSVTESLLPDEVKVERTDVISRAQAEWHFMVLSDKLYKLYKNEVEDLKEKVDKLRTYDDIMWEEMKEFWGKVQTQVNEKTLLREHTTVLKEKTNIVFDKLKDLKKEFESELKEKSAKVKKEFLEEIEEIEEKIEKGLGLKPLFEQLKTVQSKFNSADLHRNDRNNIWKRLDAAFKNIKEVRFGDKPKSNQSNVSRIQNRYNGLLNAIKKMENSIKFDDRELDFQAKRMEETDGQLEQQIRQAKVRMIEERANSKKEKLADMLKTKNELESKIAKEKEKEARIKAEEAKSAKIEVVKEEIKQKIAAEIDQKANENEVIADKLSEAAEAINKTKVKPKKKESIIDAVTFAISEKMEDVVDTVKAVAEVVGDKLEDAADKIEDKIEDIIEDIKGEEE
jgi:chromosome segregation ATPase